jgi:hypothetical protein
LTGDGCPPFLANFADSFDRLARAAVPALRAAKVA